MADVRIGGFVVTMSPDFKPGDPEPVGYLDWHAWAEAQHKAGLRQAQCPGCNLWRYPQELSTREVAYEARTARGRRVRIAEFLCLECAAKAPLPEGAAHV
jgi:hypothetical protein